MCCNTGQIKILVHFFMEILLFGFYIYGFCQQVQCSFYHVSGTHIESEVVSIIPNLLQHDATYSVPVQTLSLSSTREAVQHGANTVSRINSIIKNAEGVRSSERCGHAVAHLFAQEADIGKFPEIVEVERGGVPSVINFTYGYPRPSAELNSGSVCLSTGRTQYVLPITLTS